MPNTYWKCPACRKRTHQKRRFIRYTVEIVDSDERSHIIDIPELEVLYCLKCDFSILTVESDIQILDEYYKSLKGKDDKRNKSA